MKILVIRNKPPWPLCYGGRLHAYELCRRLAERHQLLMVTEGPCETDEWPFNFECRVARNRRLFDDCAEPEKEGFRGHRLERFFGLSPAFTRDVLKLTRQWRPDIAIGMNYQSLAHLAHITGVPTICDLLDDEALHRLRELLFSRVENTWVDLKTFVATLLYQRRYLRRVSAVTVLSEADRLFCRLHTGHPRIEYIPHGVACDHYVPSDIPVDTNRIIFWGGLGFGPNVSAVLFFAEKVWPLIRQARPQTRWSILGWGAGGSLQRIKTLPGIDLVGRVDDIRPHVGRAAVAVVPMVSGAGIKNKIMEAWAMGKPVVCTPKALGSLPGIHENNVWRARSPRGLANGVIRLLGDRQMRERIGQSARQTAVRHCSWDRAVDQLERLCLDLTASRTHNKRAIEDSSIDRMVCPTP